MSDRSDMGYPTKRKRGYSDSDDERPRSKVTRRRRDDDDEDVSVARHDDLPQPYNAKALQPAKKRAVSPSEQPRQQKRPGKRARITDSQREAARQRQIERERQAEAAEAAAAAHESRQRGINDVVREHYNNVPERGRDWRKTDSKIKGLRSFNNWIKSCVIQRFAPDEDHAPGSREQGISSGNRLLVLDMGCGKGGDLGKWQQSPQQVELYVGIDPADISIEQARDRYRSMASRGGGGRGGYNRRPPPRLFEAHFFVKDCFGQPLEQLEIVRQVGFDPSPTTMNRTGFDVVSIMFAMHYAFETEEKARSMLRNVAGALKKGGRLIGCIPNSDVLGARVREFNERKKAKEEASQADSKKNEGEDGDEKEEGEEEEEGEVEESEKTAEWGNSIYRVRFPGETPADGIFRPAFGWKYNFFLDEAVEEVPEYVVPWEAFRALAEDFNLELQYRKDFLDVWEAEKDDSVLGPLSERMGVRARDGRGTLLMTDEEKEAAAFYTAFCFYKV